MLRCLIITCKWIKELLTSQSFLKPNTGSLVLSIWLWCVRLCMILLFLSSLHFQRQSPSNLSLACRSGLPMNSLPLPLPGRPPRALATPAPATPLFCAPCLTQSMAKAASSCLSSCPLPGPSISQFQLPPCSFHDHAIPPWAASTWLVINIPIAPYITFVIGSTPFQGYFRHYLCVLVSFSSSKSIRQGLQSKSLFGRWITGKRHEGKRNGRLRRRKSQ